MQTGATARAIHTQYKRFKGENLRIRSLSWWNKSHTAEDKRILVNQHTLFLDEALVIEESTQEDKGNLSGMMNSCLLKKLQVALSERRNTAKEVSS